MRLALPTGTLAAFRQRDFAIFWSGALISNIGSWLQNLTVPYVVYAMTGSALWVGVAAAAQFLPVFAAAPLGGHLADTRERRSLLVILQSCMGLSAIGLWLTWTLGVRSVGVTLGLVALAGLTWGLTLPTWQAFVNDLVPRDCLVSAVSLNSLQFNAARSIGPAIAGLVIATLGPSWAFGLNAMSFGCVILALTLVRTRSPRNPGAAASFIRGFGEALRYVSRQPAITAVLLLVSMVGFLSTPVFSFTVVFAESVYRVGPFQLGLMNAALGIGAVLAVPLIMRAKARGGMSGVMRAGMAALGVGAVGFGLAPGLATGIVCLVAVGLGFLAAVSSGNTAIQLIVDSPLRGRVMAIRVMAFMAAAPLGALVEGWIADRIGPRQTMVMTGSLMLAVVLWLLTRRGAGVLRRVDGTAHAAA